MVKVGSFLLSKMVLQPPIFMYKVEASIKNDFAIRFFRSWSQSTRESIQNHDILVPIHRHFLKVIPASRMACRGCAEAMVKGMGKGQGYGKVDG